MNYGKFIDGELAFAPIKTHIGDTVVYNPSAEQLEADGYEPLIYTTAPEAPDGYHYISHWEQGETSINQIWTLEENDPNISDEEAFAIIVGVES